MSAGKFPMNPTPNDVTGKTPPIGIIGSGNYATALTQKLISVGHEVVMGSRHPSKRESAMISWGWDMSGLEVTSIDQCLALCDVIFVAMHPEYHLSTLGHFSDMAKNKILVDISNREESKAKTSNAQRLANTMPHSHVVKAFNTVSPLFLEVSINSMMSSAKVYVASDNKTAKKTVMDLAQEMGFTVQDFGDLKSAHDLEDYVLKVFADWMIPLLITVCCMGLWSFYITYTYFIARHDLRWDENCLHVFNELFSMTSMTTVSLTYMPGQIAAILQVYRGTKYQRFPKFLDGWLRCRKQLGLISFSVVALHVFLSTIMMSPSYYRTWFHQPKVTIPANASLTSDLTLPVSSTHMTWKGEATILCGAVAFLLMGVIAITSIPSVGEALNWAEWRCVQSHLGTVFMLLSVAHVVVMGAPGWVWKGVERTLKTLTLLSIILPSLVLFSKLLFYLTPLRCHLSKIRRGYERNATPPTSLRGRGGHFVKMDESNVDMQMVSVDDVRLEKHS